jgi:hypothetical protein
MDVPCVALWRPICGRADVPYVADVPCVALGRPICRRADVTYFADVPCVCVADVRCGAQLEDVPCVALVPNLWTCLVLCLGAHLADVPWFALGRPTLVRPY